MSRFYGGQQNVKQDCADHGVGIKQDCAYHGFGKNTIFNNF
jgi:hypothetical protein